MEISLCRSPSATSCRPSSATPEVRGGELPPRRQKVADYACRRKPGQKKEEAIAVSAPQSSLEKTPLSWRTTVLHSRSVSVVVVTGRARKTSARGRKREISTFPASRRTILGAPSSPKGKGHDGTAFRARIARLPAGKVGVFGSESCGDHCWPVRHSRGHRRHEVCLLCSSRICRENRRFLHQKTRLFKGFPVSNPHTTHQ